jgi:hypothetical protein
VIAARIEGGGDEPHRADVEETEQDEQDGRDPGPGAEESIAHVYGECVMGMASDQART